MPGSLGPAPTRPSGSQRLGRRLGSVSPAAGESGGVASSPAPAAPDWLPGGPVGGVSGWVPLGSSQTAGRRGRREPCSQWTGSPRAVTKGRSEAAAAAGEVGRGEACLGEAAAGPGRATGGGGGTMEAAAATPRPRLLLLMLAAAATLVPEATGEQRRGRAGGKLRGARAGPGLWLTPLSQTWRGAGGAGGGTRAGLSWSGRRLASRGRAAEAGRRRGSERG